MITGYQVVTTLNKSRGSDTYVDIKRKEEPLKQLIDDIKETDEEIDVIKIKIDWDKKSKKDKKIDVKLLKRTIEAEILEKTGKNISVKITN